MTVLWNPAGPVTVDIRAALPSPLAIVPDHAGVRAALGGPDRHLVVVVAPDVPLAGALDLAAEIGATDPRVGVVLVRHALDIAEIQSAIRAGVSDVLDATDVPGLAEACVRLLGRATRGRGGAAAFADPPVNGRVVTVFAAKGGCGKTTVATNLALTLHAEGRRRVCLVDLDLEFGDVAITLQVEPRVTLADAPAALAPDARDAPVSRPPAGADETGPDVPYLEDADVADLLVRARPGLDLLLAPVSPGDAEKISASLTSTLLQALTRRYDFVVVDTPSQFNDHVLAALDVADHQVLVTTPELPALKNLRLTLDMLDLLGYAPESRAIVLNRADADVGLTREDVDRVVKNPIAVHVPSSRDVPVSINRGVPLAAAQPGHPVSRALALLASRDLRSGDPVPGWHRTRSGTGLRRRRVTS